MCRGLVDDSSDSQPYYTITLLSTYLVTISNIMPLLHRWSCLLGCAFDTSRCVAHTLLVAIAAGTGASVNWLLVQAALSLDKIADLTHKLCAF